jgi:hypothetical protein
MSPTNPPTPPQIPPIGDRRAELDRIKAALWPSDEPDDVRQERIRRSLEAINSLKRPAYHLDAATWKYIAESPGVYEDEE